VDDIVIRPAKQTDDFQKIGCCIYYTDPHIYPAAFGDDPRKAGTAISKLISMEEGLFHPDNLVLAVRGDEICGIVLINRKGASWNPRDCMEAVRGDVENLDHFAVVSDTYFSAEAAAPPENHMELIACCVMPAFRGMGVAKKMLQWVIAQYPEDIMMLDVLSDNTAAIGLYRKFGFEIVDQMKGFNLVEEKRPDCYRMMRRLR